jgi:hypothetical protein
MFAPDAVVAAVAREEEREGNSIALFEWSSERVGIYTFAQRVNNACELVPENAAFRQRWAISIATPHVQIRSANHCVGVLDKYSAGFNFRSWKCYQLERFTRFGKNSS